MANRLTQSTSPYLLQHADNPVDWWEWGDEAFAEARRRDVPVLLSIGYAACHWCHVMAHESFEDDTVAAAVNAGFVAVKVDREERPDVDAVYMSATTTLTGHGGWPMTCVLTPDGDPFFAGTYFPREQLLSLLANVTTVWTQQRPEVIASGAHIAGRLRELTVPGTATPITPESLSLAVARLGQHHDIVRGGFGGAPKFPPSMVLEFLLRTTPDRRRGRAGDGARDGGGDGSRRVYDHSQAARPVCRGQRLGGAALEKMLYDNAQLLRSTAPWDHGDPLARRIASGRRTSSSATSAPTRRLRLPIDADTTVDGIGVEGATYVWTPSQLVEVLGPEDGERAAALLCVTAEGTFEHGASTLQLRQDPDDPAWWERTRQSLLASRRSRPQPSLDDKVVTSWNGLALAGLADAGALLDRPDLVDAAVGCAESSRRPTWWRAPPPGVASRRRRRRRPVVADDHGNLA